MIIYHGSTQLVKIPEIRKGDTFLDFGPGFYTTTSAEQAERWAKIKMRRENKAIGYLSIYEFDFETALKQAKIRRFHAADIEWLQFVVKNRNGEIQDTPCDMHIGPVADDNVYRSIRLFEKYSHSSGSSDQKKSERRNKHEQRRIYCDYAVYQRRFGRFNSTKK